MSGGSQNILLGNGKSEALQLRNFEGSFIIYRAEYAGSVRNLNGEGDSLLKKKTTCPGFLGTCAVLKFLQSLF